MLACRAGRVLILYIYSTRDYYKKYIVNPHQNESIPCVGVLCYHLFPKSYIIKLGLTLDSLNLMVMMI